jgi:hypothetical protein
MMQTLSYYINFLTLKLFREFFKVTIYTNYNASFMINTTLFCHFLIHFLEVSES